MRAQAGLFRYRLPKHILLFRVGKFFELYGDDALRMQSVLGVKLKTDFRRMPYAAEFPVQWEEKNIVRTIAAGFDLALISEGTMGRYVKQRFVSAIYRRDGEPPTEWMGKLSINQIGNQMK